MAGRIAILLLALLGAQCTRFPETGSQQQGGAATADASSGLPALTPGTPAPDYWRDVRPVLDKRCVVCHACFDAPCQLNLTAFEGVERGANHDEIVYAAVRLKAADPTRLFIDAPTTAGWRAKGFYSVLDDATPVSPEAARTGLMLRLLALKKQHPQPATMPPGEGFELGIDRVASLFREEQRLIPAENQLSVARGFIGAYPNAFFQVTRQDLPVFSAAVAALQSDADYRALVARFGIDRASGRFWANSDALARAYAKLEPIEAGIFDFGRLENR